MLPGVSPKAVGISRKETTPMSNSRVSTWSGIRNKLENDYLCPALRGHIQYFATSYSKSADHEGRAAIRVDGVEDESLHFQIGRLYSLQVEVHHFCFSEVPFPLSQLFLIFQRL